MAEETKDVRTPSEEPERTFTQSELKFDTPLNSDPRQI